VILSPTRTFPRINEVNFTSSPHYRWTYLAQLDFKSHRNGLALTVRRLAMTAHRIDRRRA
jgi:hypothetical protein